MSALYTLSPLVREPLPIPGVRVAYANAGLYQGQDRVDMALFEFAAGSQISLQTTRNRFAAAPIWWCRQYLRGRGPEQCAYALINAANANAGTGQRGQDDIESIFGSLEGQGLKTRSQFLPFSTGVIGEYLPTEKMIARIPGLFGALAEDASQWQGAARAILTTDTVAKTASAELRPVGGGQPIRLTGIAKGSGMIHPDMATMLCFIACDASVEGEWFDAVCREGVVGSFNRISVDGDTSTNDACLTVATGHNPAVLGEADRDLLAQAIHLLMDSLARQIVADGEGANVVFEVRVRGAVDNADAAAVAEAVATSPLVKTAIGARDPNWGRILAAVGRSKAASLDIGRIDIRLSDALIVSQGGRDEAYREEDGVAALGSDDIVIDINLNLGSGQGRCLGCDLSAEYVRINSSYRS